MKIRKMFRLIATGACLVALTSVALAQLESAPAARGGDSPRYAPANEHGQYRYMIRFAEPGLLQRQLERSTGQGFDISTPDMRQVRSAVRAEQTVYIQGMGRTLGRELDITHYYQITHSGLAIWLSEAEAEAVAAMDGVVGVERDQVYEPSTYRGPEFIGAGAIWDGSVVSGGERMRGEGLAVSVLDTGIDIDHPAFNNDPACGHGVGDVPDKLLGAYDCSSTDSAGICNGPDPSDSIGHGTHVASIAAGNTLDNSASPPPDLPDGVEMSGVAPCAHVRAYHVCHAPQGRCFTADTVSAINSTLAHQVEDDIPIVAMNFSIGGGSSPWSDSGEMGKLDLVDAGIFVAASAGNTQRADQGGPVNPVGEVIHRGPWVMSTGNISHDGVLGMLLSLAGGPTDRVAVLGQDMELNSVYQGQLRWAGDVDSDNELGCEAFPADSFDGQAALISRGECNFSVKIDNAAAAGADFMVVYQNVANLPPFAMSWGEANPTIPAVMVTRDTGQAAIDALGGGAAAVTVDPQIVLVQEAGFGDILNAGSLIGPTPSPFQNIQKPDIAAPGTNIYAAVRGGYGHMTGTSMASPHVAGGATLLAQAQPDWTPMEIGSALRMTTVAEGRKADAETPWDADDVGSGRTDLSRAARAGLVMDETKANFEAANPADGGDVRTLNLPAVRDMDCENSCSFTRTLRNTLDVATEWTIAGTSVDDEFDIEITPDTLNFTGDTDETAEITITLKPLSGLTDKVYFGEVVLTEASGHSPDLRITAALKGTGEQSAGPVIEVNPDSFQAELEEGGSDTQTLTISNVGDAGSELTYSVFTHELNAVVLETGDGHGRSEHGTGPVELIIDDMDAGQLTGAVGVANQQIAWFNRFTPEPSQLPFTLEEVQIYFVTTETGSAQVGDEYDIYVWSAPDGDPTGTIDLLASVTGQSVAQLNAFNSVALPAGVVIDADSGDVLIGAVNRTTREPYTVAATDNLPSQQRSWIAFNFSSGEAGNPPDFSQASSFGLLDEFAEGTNFAIRGLGTRSASTACQSPGDMPWLSVSPGDGTVAAGDSDEVTVSFDASELTQGVYEAQLCVTSNDPDNALVTLPVSLTVGGNGEAPIADISPASFEFEVPAGQTDADTLNIGNTGTAGLIWNSHAAERCEVPGDIPWLNVSPDSSTTPAGDSVPVDVTADTGDLNEGVYEALLCVITNDPAAELVEIPVTLRVTEAVPGILEVEPATLDFGEVGVNADTTRTVTVRNAAEAGEALELNAIDLSGNGFAITGGDCESGTELVGGASCLVEVSFTPTEETTYAGTVTVSAANGQIEFVELSGTGTDDEHPSEIFSDRFEE